MAHSLCLDRIENEVNEYCEPKKAKMGDCFRDHHICNCYGTDKYISQYHFIGLNLVSFRWCYWCLRNDGGGRGFCRFESSPSDGFFMFLGVPSHIYVGLLLLIAHPYELTLLIAMFGDAIAWLFSEEFRLRLRKLLLLP